MKKTTIIVASIVIGTVGISCFLYKKALDEIGSMEFGILDDEVNVYKEDGNG